MPNLKHLLHPLNHDQLGSCGRKCVPLVVVSLMFVGLPPAADAEKANSATAAQLVENAKNFYGIGKRSNACKPDRATVDEIVVCARGAPDQRLDHAETPSASLDAKTIALGAPLAGAGISVAVSICFLQKCPKRLYFIDLKSLPEAPPGSDADKIAKGEAR